MPRKLPNQVLSYAVLIICLICLNLLVCLIMFFIFIRAFDQLVVVLGRFQTKIKSETSKKSSEILAATREIICQHLEGVEAQMQADV